MASRVSVGLVAMMVIVLAGPGSAASSDTGTIVGEVVYAGDPPPVKKIEITKDKEKCGTEKVLEELVVGPDRGLRWVVVSLEGAEWNAEAPEVQGIQLDQSGCRFVPHVLVVPTDVDLSVLNSDGILHNVHTYSKANLPMNRAQPAFRKKMRMKFGEAEVIRVACDVHNWMGAWIVVSDNPYTAVTDENGSFRLTGIKPGTYKLKLWHERLGEQTKEVTVRGGEETKVTLEMAIK